MKRLLCFCIAAIAFFAVPVQAQVTLGVVPSESSLVRSQEEARLFAAYLEDRLKDKVVLRVFDTEEALYKSLASKSVDVAVVSNVFYHEYSKSLTLLANFSLTEKETHKLLLLASRNGPVNSIGDIKPERTSLVLDQRTKSRMSFLTETFEGDPQKIFERISVSSQVVDTLSVLNNGSYELACVEDGLLETVRSFDPGLVQQVKVLKSSASYASDPVVAREGLSPELRTKLTEILLEMESDSDGEQILLGLKITRFVLPLTKLSMYPSEVDPNQYKETPKKKKVIAKPTKEAPPKEAPVETSKSKPETSTGPEAVEKPVARVETAPVVPTPEKVVTTLQPPPVEKIETLPAVSTRPEVIGTASEPPPSKRIETTGTPEPNKQKKQPENTPSERVQVVPPAQPDVLKIRYSILTLGAGVILFVLLLIVVFLLVRRRGEPRAVVQPIREEPVRSEVKPKPTVIDLEEEANQAPSVQVRPLAAHAPSQPQGVSAQNPLVELRGELKTIRLPDLLQLMASCNNTGTLVIQSKHDEKSLYFREGKICSASCLDKDNKNKLGYLLIKLGKITEKERARALALCADDPSKRLGHALVEIGAVKKSDIREALRVQAEEIIYSLFLFPEGHFEFIKNQPRMDPEESLSLDVMNLMMEGARREDEWGNMRQALPSMDIILKFSKDGKGKLDGKGLSRDQEMILTLVNGERSISEICALSTLVDFEVCNFLYRLMSISVLEKVNVTGDSVTKV